MNNENIESGRIQQKLKTRNEILKAAKRLVPFAKKITLEDVAREANISRATIYRYFSNIDLLIIEASLDIHHKSVPELADEVKELSFENRLYFIQDYYIRLAREQELTFRRYLSVVLSESVSSTKKLRGARRVKSLTTALTPYKRQLPRQTFKDLVHITSVLTGIDALVTAKDVCGLDNDDSARLLHWGAEMILKGIKSDLGKDYSL